ncbi:hypothetical protein V6S02_11930 [Microbacterium sp. CCNWLW134]|uniref:hypothetical protein n=1 Tax=Microbacterium sp. CCNWLW134 TaxID=3122064 RepID=UPI00301052AA
MNTAAPRSPEFYRVVMAELVAIILIAAFLLVAIGWRLRDGARSRHGARDDTQRAGATISLTPDAAARHAEGTTAWTRISGP